MALNRAGISTPSWPFADGNCWRVRFIRTSAEEFVSVKEAGAAAPDQGSSPRPSA